MNIKVREIVNSIPPCLMYDKALKQTLFVTRHNGDTPYMATVLANQEKGDLLFVGNSFGITEQQLKLYEPLPKGTEVVITN